MPVPSRAAIDRGIASGGFGGQGRSDNRGHERASGDAEGINRRPASIPSRATPGAGYVALPGQSKGNFARETQGLGQYGGFRQGLDRIGGAIGSGVQGMFDSRLAMLDKLGDAMTGANEWLTPKMESMGFSNLGNPTHGAWNPMDPPDWLASGDAERGGGGLAQAMAAPQPQAPPPQQAAPLDPQLAEMIRLYPWLAEKFGMQGQPQQGATGMPVAQAGAMLGGLVGGI